MNGTTACSKDRILPVICPYCNGAAVLADDGAVSTKTPSGLVWLCRHCEAWVGTHANSPTHRPMGRLAKAQLRALKVKARVLFEQMVRSAIEQNGWKPTKARDRAREWFSCEMGIAGGAFNIGDFDEAQTQQVIYICESMGRRVRKEAA